MYKKLLILIVIAGLTMVGCIKRHIPMTPEAANTIKDREVATAKRDDKPSFIALRPAHALFGPLAMPMAISEGNKIVAENNIEDIAVYIGEQLSAELAKKYGTKVSSESVVIKGDDVQQISQSSPDSELILDIKTMGWGFFYNLFVTTYRVDYYAWLRLIDTKSGKVLSEDHCVSRSTDRTPNSPTYDELLANGAERLKKELKDAADFCVGDFKSKVFKL